VKTLPDYLRAGLDIVSIGLNPSVYSAERGFYFARGQNRFWRALNASKLVRRTLTPGEAAIEQLFRDHGIGFTDVVKRPSGGAGDLAAADFKHWAPLLREKLLRYAPRIAWFHGKVAYQNYLRYAEAVHEQVEWGEQPRPIGESRVFVTPNPSGANATFAVADLIAAYDELARLRDRLKDSSPAKSP
jgi:double-stranded uracil-DNA glycosylase